MAVTGIGGIFIRARDPEALARWYRDHLGVGAGKYGRWTPETGPSVFSTFATDSDYFPIGRAFMLNFRVTDLAAMIVALRHAGIVVITNPEWDAPGIGRFARLDDPEGNPIELWEPPVA